MTRFAVITGGTKGIGKSLIRQFADKGFDIATFSRHPEELENLKQEIEKDFKVSLYYKPTNALVKSEVYDFGLFVNQLLRPVDVLINNAGFFLPGKLTEEPDEVFEKMLLVNLNSAYYLTKSLVQAMKTRKRGHIFNLCSVASVKAYPNGGSYSISKAALLGFSRTLREELKEFQIKVTSVFPGATFTDSWKDAGLPESRFMPPEDVAEIIWSCFNLSDRTVVEEILMRPLLGDI